MTWIRNVKIVRNVGNVNIGDYYNISPISVSKSSNGCGASNQAVFLNGKRVKQVTDDTIDSANT